MLRECRGSSGTSPASGCPWSGPPGADRDRSSRCGSSWHRVRGGPRRAPARRARSWQAPQTSRSPRGMSALARRGVRRVADRAGLTGGQRTVRDARLQVLRETGVAGEAEGRLGLGERGLARLVALRAGASRVRGVDHVVRQRRVVRRVGRVATAAIRVRDREAAVLGAQARRRRCRGTGCRRSWRRRRRLTGALPPCASWQPRQLPLPNGACTCWRLVSACSRRVALPAQLARRLDEQSLVGRRVRRVAVLATALAHRRVRQGRVRRERREVVAGRAHVVGARRIQEMLAPAHVRIVAVRAVAGRERRVHHLAAAGGVVSWQLAHNAVWSRIGSLVSWHDAQSRSANGSWRFGCNRRAWVDLCGSWQPMQSSDAGSRPRCASWKPALFSSWQVKQSPGAGCAQEAGALTAVGQMAVEAGVGGRRVDRLALGGRRHVGVAPGAHERRRSPRAGAAAPRRAGRGRRCSRPRRPARARASRRRWACRCRGSRRRSRRRLPQHAREFAAVRVVAVEAGAVGGRGVRAAAGGRLGDLGMAVPAQRSGRRARQQAWPAPPRAAGGTPGSRRATTTSCGKGLRQVSSWIFRWQPRQRSPGFLDQQLRLAELCGSWQTVHACLTPGACVVTASGGTTPSWQPRHSATRLVVSRPAR